METRLVAFGGSTVTLEAIGAEARRVVALLLADLSPVVSKGQPANASHWTIRLVADDHAPLQMFEGPSAATLQPRGAKVPEEVLGQICYHLADKSNAGLLFHAAGVSWGECGLLLPGAVMAGKTTLVAWLLAQGGNYLTDELVYVPQGSTMLHAFPRPLNVRPAGLAALQTVLTSDLDEEHKWSCRTNTLIAPGRLGAPQVLPMAPLRLLIFPRYVAHSPLLFTRLSMAAAGLRLMETLINGRNLLHHGFPEVARLARQTPAYALIYSTFAQLEPWLANILPELLC